MDCLLIFIFNNVLRLNLNVIFFDVHLLDGKSFTENIIICIFTSLVSTFYSTFGLSDFSFLSDFFLGDLFFFRSDFFLSLSDFLSLDFLLFYFFFSFFGDRLLFFFFWCSILSDLLSFNFF